MEPTLLEQVIYSAVLESTFKSSYCDSVRTEVRNHGCDVGPPVATVAHRGPLWPNVGPDVGGAVSGNQSLVRIVRSTSAS